MILHEFISKYVKKKDILKTELNAHILFLPSIFIVHIAQGCLEIIQFIVRQILTLGTI